METAYQEQAKVFKALCDPKRLAILEQLRSGEKCACILQEPLGLTQSGLSYHMKIPVSYTHLDVYKRQQEGRSKSGDIKWGLRKALGTPESRYYQRICYGYTHDKDG